MDDRKGAPTVRVGGFKTVSVTRDELAEIMVADCIAARKAGERWIPKTVFSSNGQGIALAGRNPDFARIMDAADAIHADGMSVVKASRRTHAPLPERIATTDFFHDAARAASLHGLRFFMLGASEEQNVAAIAKIKKIYPGLEIAGRHHGYFADEESGAVCDIIRSSRADVLWVALGKPRQEFWSIASRERLAGVGWIKTCGGLYSYLAGDAPRAPLWMQNAGLEWLYRTLDDPKRLAWRYLTTNPYALYRLMRHTERA